MLLRILTLFLTPIFAFLPFMQKPNAEINKSLTPSSGGKFTSSDENASKEYRIKKVVIDAGHGGHDSGCHHADGMEKKNTLAMALMLGRKMKENFPEVEVIYTRDRDVFVELDKRADIANKAKADLFISIHCNSTETGSVHGTETYVMGTHKMEENLSVAKRENASILLEDDYQRRYDGFDPNSNEAYIIFKLYQNAYLEKSILFGKFIEECFKNEAGRRSIGVKQAGFVVLRQAAMPSVLIETGFLNHPVEGKFISSQEGQNRLTDAMLSAFSKYKAMVETKDNSAPRPVSVAQSASARSSEFTSTQNNEDEIVYKIQLATSDKNHSHTPRWKNIDNLEVVLENKLYKYYRTGISTYSEAQSVLKQMKSQGFNDAFIVTFRQNKRITGGN